MLTRHSLHRMKHSLLRMLHARQFALDKPA